MRHYCDRREAAAQEREIDMSLNVAEIEATIDLLESLDDDQCLMPDFFSGCAACIAGWVVSAHGWVGDGEYVGDITKGGVKSNALTETRRILGLDDVHVVIAPGFWPDQVRELYDCAEYTDRDLMIERFEYLLETGE